eukprot:13721787-Ditylum_brightwellii.AAC.1
MDKGAEEMEMEGCIKGAPVLGMVCTRKGDDIIVGLVKEGGGAPEKMEESGTNGSIHKFHLRWWKYDDTAHLNISGIKRTYLFGQDSVLQVPTVGIGLGVRQAFFDHRGVFLKSK